MKSSEKVSEGELVFVRGNRSDIVNDIVGVILIDSVSLSVRLDVRDDETSMDADHESEKDSVTESDRLNMAVLEKESETEVDRDCVSENVTLSEILSDGELVRVKEDVKELVMDFNEVSVFDVV